MDLASGQELERQAKGFDNKVFFTPVRLAYIGVFVLAIALYYRSFSYGLIWDDHAIVGKRAIGGGTLQGVFTKPFLFRYYRPFTSLSYWLDYQWFGTTSFLWHQTSTLLHGVAAVVTGFLARELTKRPWAGVLAALAFAVQPAQVAVATWIGARTDALSAVLIPLFLWALVKYLDKKKTAWLVASGVILYTSAMVKEQNLAILLAVPLVVWWMGKSDKKLVLPLGIALGVPTLVFVLSWFQFYALTIKPLVPTLGLTMFRTGASMINYLRLLFVPETGPQVTVSVASYAGSPLYLVGLLGLVAITVLAAVSYRRKTVVGLALAIALVLYLPVSNLIPMPSLIVGPYRIATVGVLVAVALGASLEGWAERKQYLPAILGGAVIVTGAYSCWINVPVWSSQSAYFATMSKHDPWSIIGRFNAVSTAIADDQYERALDLTENYMDWISGQSDWRAEVDQGKGLTISDEMSWRVRSNTGVKEEAEGYLCRLLNLRSVALFHLGKQELAEMGIKSALVLSPDFGPALLNMGDVLAKKDQERALEYYRRAVKVDPTATAYQHLAMLLDEMGDLEASADAYRNAISHSGLRGDLYVALAEVEVKRGRGLVAADALDSAEKAGVVNQARYEKVKRAVEQMKGRAEEVRKR